MLLVVSPLDNSDAWLGGSLVGRDFWRGLRGGGIAGSRAFKRASKLSYDSMHGTTANNPPPSQGAATPSQVSSNNVPAIPIKSQSIKAELNRVVRQTLRWDTHFSIPLLYICSYPYRDTTKVKNAEMKWTKPHSLESIYGVKIVGWPTTIRFQNPSNNNMDSNRLLLEGFNDGTIRFVRLNENTPDLTPVPDVSVSPSPSTSIDSVEPIGSKRKRVE